MGRPRLQKQLVPVPLTSGLSQKEDPAHLQSGQAIQIINFVKDKQSTLGKSPGYKGLGITPTEGANVSYVAAVAAHKTSPLVVATDTSYGPGLYAYSDGDNAVTLIDRVSEVFIPTPQTIAAYQQTITDIDVAVVAPAGVPTAVVHTWLLAVGSLGVLRVYYKVTDYATGAMILPAQEVAVLVAVSGSFLAPKLTTCMNGATTAALILTAGLQGANALYAVPISLSNFSASTSSIIINNIQNPGVYDVCPVDDDSTRFVVAYEKSSARNIVVTSFNSSTLAQVATGNFADTTWSGAAGNPHITGFAVRASVGSSAAWLAYAWSTGVAASTQAFVRAGAQAYPSLSSSFATAVDLTNGLTSTYPGPQLLDIKEVSQALGVQQVVWSPPNTKVGYDPTYVATPQASHPPPLTAIYQSAFFQSAGAATLEANNPRWTNGVTLASRMFPYQLSQGLGNSNANSAGQAFVVGFMPSQNLNPTWSGVANVTTPTTSAVNNVPYASNVSFSGGRAYGNTAPGGAQAEMVLSGLPPSTYSGYSGSSANIFPRPLPPVDITISNVAVTEPASGYTGAPTATLNWGVGAVFSTFFANSSGAPAVGVLTSINVVTALNGSGANGLLPVNISTSGGAGHNVNLTAATGVFTPEMVGLNVTISNCSNAGDNGTFAITNVRTDGVVMTISNPNGVAETLTPFANVLNNQGGGMNYDPKPNAVPVWVHDYVSGNIFTDLAVAVVGTSGNTAGQVTSVTLTGAGANANIHTASLAWIPQPTLPLPGNSACQATSSTGLIESAGYENVQGSFFLFSMDTFADFTTPNDTGTPYRNTPMRLVAALKPRLGLNAIMSSTRTLPHISQASRTGVPPWGSPVFDLPINVSPTSVGIMQFQAEIFPGWVLDAPMYLGDELGGLTALAAGLPTLTDGDRCMGFAEPYFPEGLYVYPSTPFAPQTNGNLLPGASYQYIATYERMDRVGNVHRSGRSVPVDLVTLPTYDDSRYESTIVIPTMGFSPSQHGTNEGNLANVGTQPVIQIHLSRTVAPAATPGGAATVGGTVFYDLSSTSQGIAANDLWSPYIVVSDGVTSASGDPALTTNPLLYGDGSNGTDPGSIVDNLMPPALQGLIVHKNRWWGFEGSNVWFTKAFTSGEGPGFNELMAFSVDDGSGDITALASMDERLFIFKRDRIFYVSGDGPTDNLSSNDLQPPQRIQSDVGAISQASIISAPSGVYFLSDDGLYQITRKLDVAHYGSFVDDTLTTYPVITSGCLDLVNGRLVWTASKANTGSLTPGSIIIMYSYLWDAWTVEQLDEGGGNYTNFQVTSAKLTGTPPALTVGGNYANTGGPFVLRERSDGVYLTPNSAGTATYQQSLWQSPWLKAQDFQGFARWMLVTLAWYKSDVSALQITFDYNYSSNTPQTFTISAAAMATAAKAGTPYGIVQWEEQPNNPKAESFRITITDLKDSVSSTNVGKGSVLLACTVTMGLKDGTKTFPVPVTQRGTA